MSGDGSNLETLASHVVAIVVSSLSPHPHVGLLPRALLVGVPQQVAEAHVVSFAPTVV